MRRILSSAALAAALITTAGEIAAQESPSEPQRSALDGVYSSSQAGRGESTFKQICGMCHGTAEFTGATFQRNWVGRTAFDMFDQLRTTMPMDNPGGLSRQEYLDVVTYLLRLNGYPPGEDALDGEDEVLRQVRIPARGD